MITDFHRSHEIVMVHDERHSFPNQTSLHVVPVRNVKLTVRSVDTDWSAKPLDDAVVATAAIRIANREDSLNFSFTWPRHAIFTSSNRNARTIKTIDAVLVDERYRSPSVEQRHKH